MSRLGKSVRWFIHRSWLSQAATENAAVRELAYNYVAGTKVHDAAAVGERLAGQGLSLGYNYLARDERELATGDKLAHLLEVLGDHATGVDLSVQPSSLGLRNSAGEARERLARLCRTAAGHGATVTLEMQQVPEHPATIKLFRDVVRDHPDLGITLTVNVRRAERDVRDLAVEGRRIRLCVGSYPTTKDEAWTAEHDKSLALVRCVRIAMESGAYPMVASHDPRIIEITQDLARRNGRTPQTWEFQMFHGVRPLEQRRLVDIGLTCRTYIPFGPAWYEYLATRVAARPRMFVSYTRALLDKR